jgi:hypothetical protein
MSQRIKYIRSLIGFIFSPLGRPYLQAFFYVFMANTIAGCHLCLIFGNCICLAMLIGFQPVYIWLPMISLMVSPVIGGSHCFMNRLENHYRLRAGMPLITDRLEELFTRSH